MLKPLALFLPGLLCFAAFSWALKGHFRIVGPLPPGMKMISLLTVAGFLWFTARLVGGATSALWEAAIGFFTLSIALFAWAVASTRRTRPTLAFAKDEPSFLIDQGPYRLVRHPFYLSYLLFWIGTAIASPGLLPWGAPAVMLMVYWNAARCEEQKFARSNLAQAYENYRKHVGMFLPHLG